MIIEISSIIIASLSFILSIYIVSRDRKDKKLNNLCLVRQRILDIFDDKEVLTVEDMVDFFEINPDSEEAQRYKAKSGNTMFRVDREFEFACYLVTKKQVDFYLFFDLFRKWLAMRALTWDSSSEYKKHNLPYTWGIIEFCKKKKLLPLKKLYGKTKLKKTSKEF